MPDSALINGAGRYVGGPEVKRAVLNVTSGKRYRFRVINMSAIGSYTFSMEGHMFTIIVRAAGDSAVLLVLTVLSGSRWYSSRAAGCR